MGLIDGSAAPLHAVFGLFKMRAAYSGAAIRVKDGLANQADIGFDANGNLNTAALSGNAPYKVVKWYDQSGIGRDWTNLSGANEPTLNTSEMGLRFDSAKFLNVTNLSALTEGEIFIYRKIDSDPSTSLTGYGGIGDFGVYNADTSYVPLDDDRIYDAFGSTTRKNALVCPGGLTAYHIYSAYSKASDWANYKNGTLIHQTGTNIVGFRSAPLLGNTAFSAVYMVGYIRAVVLFEAKVTDGERTVFSTMASYVPAPARPTVSWPDGSNDVPKTGVLFFHEARSLVNVNALADAGQVSRIYDYSPNAIDLECSSTNPTLDIDGAGGKAAMVFSGNNNPMSGSAATMTVKHLFILAAYQDAAFAIDFPGLITGIGGGDLLTGGPAGYTTFRNFADSRTYRKNNVSLAETAAAAPMSNVLGIIEISSPTGWVLDGVRLGQNKWFTERKWKGVWVMDLAYNRVLTTAERAAVYEYIAKIHFVWQQNAAGKNVWPFDPDWGRQIPRSKRVLSSVAVSGASKFRSKDTKKRSIDATFTDREQAEFGAAERFWDVHHPSTSFIYRDNAKSPADDIELRFTSDLGEQSDDYNGVSYSWQGAEV